MPCKFPLLYLDLPVSVLSCKSYGDKRRSESLIGSLRHLDEYVVLGCGRARQEHAAYRIHGQHEAVGAQKGPPGHLAPIGSHRVLLARVHN